MRRQPPCGYRVAMLARKADRLQALAQVCPDAFAVPCDVSDDAALAAGLAHIGDVGGPPQVVVHNAVGGAPMQAAGSGAILVTGNTASQRGRANFAGFAPTKAAQRILAESLARDLGPKGVHVAYLIIDAVIDVPWQRERMPNAPDDFFCSPASIAAEVFHLAHQPRDAWSFLAEVRPYRETW